MRVTNGLLGNGFGCIEYCEECWDEINLCECQGNIGALEEDTAEIEANAELYSERPEARDCPTMGTVHSKTKRKPKNG